MIINRTNTIIFLVGVFLGLCTGFFTGKAIYDRPIEESVTRDTVRITDTIPHYYPQPVDGTVVKYVTKYLPVVKTDTLTNNVVSWLHDTVAVEVPIESKHYHADEYDAYISGFEPSLDSIFVYQKKEYITETITRMKPPNKWELDVVGGIDYNTTSQKYTPYAVGELLYKPNRLQIGFQGGVVKQNEKFDFVVGGKIKIRIL